MTDESGPPDERTSRQESYYRTSIDHLWRFVGVVLVVALAYLQLVERNEVIEWRHYLVCAVVAEPRATADFVRSYLGDAIKWLKSWGPGN